MTMFIEIARTDAEQPFHSRLRSDRGNTEPTWTTETFKRRVSAEKSVLRLAEMFGWRGVCIEWDKGRVDGWIATLSGARVARVVYVDERED